MTITNDYFERDDESRTSVAIARMFANAQVRVARTIGSIRDNNREQASRSTAMKLREGNNQPAIVKTFMSASDFIYRRQGNSHDCSNRSARSIKMMFARANNHGDVHESKQ